MYGKAEDQVFFDDASFVQTPEQLQGFVPKVMDGACLYIQGLSYLFRSLERERENLLWMKRMWNDVAEYNKVLIAKKDEVIKGLTDQVQFLKAMLEQKK